MARIALAERGKASPSEQVADVIEATIGRETTVSEFIEALEAAGIHVQANVASTGKLNGFSYTLDGVTVTAKALGRSFTLSNLRSEEHTSELQSLMRISYAVFCLKKKRHRDS